MTTGLMHCLLSDPLSTFLDLPRVRVSVKCDCEVAYFLIHGHVSRISLYLLSCVELSIFSCRPALFFFRSLANQSSEMAVKWCKLRRVWNWTLNTRRLAVKFRVQTFSWKISFVNFFWYFNCADRVDWTPYIASGKNDLQRAQGGPKTLLSSGLNTIYR